MAMPYRLSTKLFLFIFLGMGVVIIQGLPTQVQHHPYHSHRNLHFQNCNGGSRRMMIGSMVPRCTYNECRGCKHRCMPKQVPVEVYDPINSAYRYICICQRQ